MAWHWCARCKGKGNPAFQPDCPEGPCHAEGLCAHEDRNSPSAVQDGGEPDA